MPQSSVKSCKKIQVLLNDMSHEQSYKCIANRGRTISRTLLVHKPNRMVNPYRRVCHKTNQEVNTGGQREGRGMRGEEGKNRTQDSAHSEGDGRVVLSQKAEEEARSGAEGLSAQLQGDTGHEQEGCQGRSSLIL